MPQALQFLVGTETVSITIPLTAVQLRTVIGRAAVQMGIDTTNKTEVEIAQAVLRHTLRYLSHLSMEKQRIELLAAQQAAMDAKLAADNKLVDDAELNQLNRSRGGTSVTKVPKSPKSK